MKTLNKAILNALSLGRSALSLDSWDATELPGSIGSLTDLEQLEIFGYGITSIPDAIGNLGQLKRLAICATEIQTLPSTLVDLSSLTHLWLIDNKQLKHLPSSIGRLSSLSELCIEGDWDGLDELPMEIGELVNLRRLIVRSTNCRGLPSFLGDLSALTHLHVDCNRLSALPSTIGKLSRLEELDVSGNKIEELPDALGMLPALKALDIHRNRIRHLTSSVWRLASLRHLDCSSNDLSELPEELYLLKELRSLTAYSNRLTSIPESITTLANLARLDIANNKINALPKSLPQMASLVHLSVDNLDLSTAPARATKRGDMPVVSSLGNSLSFIAPTALRPEALSLRLKVLTPAQVCCVGVRAALRNIPSFAWHEREDRLADVPHQWLIPTLRCFALLCRNCRSDTSGALSTLASTSGLPRASAAIRAIELSTVDESQQTKFFEAAFDDTGSLGYRGCRAGGDIDTEWRLRDVNRSLFKKRAAEAVYHDINAADAGLTPEELISLPLWHEMLWYQYSLHAVAHSWRMLKKLLARDTDHWQIWTEWYEEYLRGDHRLSGIVEETVWQAPDLFWDLPVAQVNRTLSTAVNQ